MMREEYGTWGNEGERREERGKACDQEVEAVKISIGLGLYKHRIGGSAAQPFMSISSIVHLMS